MVTKTRLPLSYNYNFISLCLRVAPFIYMTLSVYAWSSKKYFVLCVRVQDIRDHVSLLIIYLRILLINPMHECHVYIPL